MKITTARIHPENYQPYSLELPSVFVTTEDGVETKLFSYYPDEISFTPEEFVGLTIKQAKQLHYDKDVAYLRAP